MFDQIRDESVETFKSYKKLAERALEQVSDDEFFRVIDAESNSLAAIVKHIGGNLKSRWTDFLTTDGEKPDRDRDSEFVTDADTRRTLMQLWETGWNAVNSSVSSLAPADFAKTVTIRGEEFSVVKAVNRSLTHTAYHVGQIAFLAKHLRSSDWQTLSVPRGKSKEFNQFVEKEKPSGNYLDAAEKFK